MASQGKAKPARERETGSEMARRFRSNPLVFIGTFFILILVVVAFVFITPAGAVFGGMGDGDLTFGRYDGVPISYSPGNFFARQYDASFRQMQMWMGGELPEWAHGYVWRQSFEAAALHAAILRTMQRAGYEPPSRVVDREMAGLPIFTDNGVFSPALYRQMDENRRLALWRQVREDVIRTRFLDDAEGLHVPSAEADFFGRMASTERGFDVAVFSVDAFPDSEVAAFAERNPDLFRSTHLSIMTINGSEREARRIRDSVVSGETDFAEAARTHSSDMFANWGGDMWPRMAHELRSDIPDEGMLEAALALSAGEYGELTRTPAGWVFFRAEDDTRAADLDDPTVMSGVRSYMGGFERGMMEDWAIARAREFAELVAKLGFDGASAEWPDLDGRNLGPVPINFGAVDLFPSIGAQGEDDLAGASDNENFWNVAFSTPLGRPSEPVVQGGNVLVLVPSSETEAPGLSVGSVSDGYAGWLSGTNWQMLQRHVMDSPKFEDRFDEAYSRLFR